MMPLLQRCRSISRWQQQCIGGGRNYAIVATTYLRWLRMMNTLTLSDPPMGCSSSATAIYHKSHCYVPLSQSDNYGIIVLLQSRGFVRSSHDGGRNREPVMRNCKSIEELIDTAYDHKDMLSPRGMASFWTMIPTLLQRRGRPTPKYEHMQMQIDELIGKTLQSIHTYGTRDIATIAISLAKIAKKVDKRGNSKGSPQQILYNVLIGTNSSNKQFIFNEIAYASVPLLYDFDARHLSNLIYAFGLAEVVIPVEDGSTFFDSLADVAKPILHEFNEQGLSNMLWAFGNMKISNPQLFEEAGDAIVAFDGLDDFWPQALSNILWAFTTLGESHPKLFKKIADHIVALKDLDRFGAQALSNILWAYATAKESHPKLFEKATDHIVSLDNLDKFDAQAFSNILWAYATAKESHSKLLKKVGNHIVSLDNLDGFIPQHLSNIVWAYATAKESHPKLFQKLSDAAIKRQDELKSQELSNIVWAYATNKQIDQHLFSSLVPTVEANLGKCTVQNLSNIAWAYAVANVDATSVSNEEFINACMQKENDFNFEELSQLHQWQLWQHELKSNVTLSSSLQKKCYDAFISADPTPSATQDDVISQVSSMGLQLEEEVLTKSGYRLDALVEVNGKGVGIEVDGPSHFLIRSPTGSTILKHRQITNLDGISIVSVPYWEWDKLKKSEKKQQYLLHLLGLD